MTAAATTHPGDVATLAVVAMFAAALYGFLKPNRRPR